MPFRVIPTDSGRMAMLFAGDLRAIDARPLGDLARLRRDKAMDVTQIVGWRTMYVGVDMERDASPHPHDANGGPLTHNTQKDAATSEQAIIHMVRHPAHLRALRKPLPVAPGCNGAFLPHAVAQG